jgi:hypothetical protein
MHIGSVFGGAYDHPLWRAGATSIAVKDLMSERFLSATLLKQPVAEQGYERITIA